MPKVTTKLVYRNKAELKVSINISEFPLPIIVVYCGCYFQWYDYADHIAEPNGQYNEIEPPVKTTYKDVIQ